MSLTPIMNGLERSGATGAEAEAAMRAAENARAAEDAPPDLLGAEEQARAIVNTEYSPAVMDANLDDLDFTAAYRVVSTTAEGEVSSATVLLALPNEHANDVAAASLNQPLTVVIVGDRAQPQAVDVADSAI